MLYVDNAATSFPKPASVYEKMDTFYRHYGANPGRSDYKLGLMALEEVERVRTRLSHFFHCPHPNRLVFTFNATDALNMAIRGVLRAGDEVIMSVTEHNSVLRPLKFLENELSLKIHTVNPFDPEAIKPLLNSKTRLVVQNHASNVNGVVFPIGEMGALIKKYSDAYFLVDASQTAGVIPIDVIKDSIDLLAFTGHKSLYGPTGTGGLYVAPEVLIKPYRCGGSGIHSELDFQPDEFPYYLEAGTLNLSGIVGLGAGLDFVINSGIDQIRNHERSLKDALFHHLGHNTHLDIYTSPKETGLGIFSFNIKTLSPSVVSQILDGEFDIATRSGLHCAPSMHRHLGTYPNGTVRISFGIFNTPAEVDALAQSIEKITLSLKIGNKSH